jgi:hypothetical protein
VYLVPDRVAVQCEDVMGPRTGIHAPGSAGIALALLLLLNNADLRAAQVPPRETTPASATDQVEEELDEVLIDGRRPSRKASEIISWMRRLVGQFTYDGHVDLAGQGNPDDQQPAQGYGDCVPFGPAPAVQCEIRVSWLEVRAENGESIPGAVRELDRQLPAGGADHGRAGSEGHRHAHGHRSGLPACFRSTSRSRCRNCLRTGIATGPSRLPRDSVATRRTKMMTMRRVISVVLAQGLALQSLLAGQAPPPSAAPAFTNLQVHPRDTPVDQLLAEMQRYEMGLGVDCDYCHVVTGTITAGVNGALPGGFDFASDDKAAKRATRQMVTMLRAINGMTPQAVAKPANQVAQVQCFSCHRGMTTPPEPLRDVLDRTTSGQGLPAAIARYRELRNKNLGSAAYDFSDAAMSESGSGTHGLPGYALQLVFNGKPDAALAWLDLNLEYYPASAATWKTKALVQAIKGDMAGAAASVEKAIALAPQDAQLQEWASALRK